jgi:hypothetical protein
MTKKLRDIVGKEMTLADLGDWIQGVPDAEKMKIGKLQVLDIDNSDGDHGEKAKITPDDGKHGYTDASTDKAEAVYDDATKKAKRLRQVFAMKDAS